MYWRRRRFASESGAGKRGLGGERGWGSLEAEGAGSESPGRWWVLICRWVMVLEPSALR
jgi:hypothetical protein